MAGEFAYITTKNTFNGYENSSHIWTEESGVITVDSATNGACFYQEKNFVASDHVEKIWLKNKKISRYNALFLTTLLNFNSYKYSYGRKRNLKNIKKEKILFPIDNDKKIDWEYIEKIVKNLHSETIDKFKLTLSKIA